MSDFVLDPLVLGNDLWRAHANMIVCLCMQSYTEPFTDSDDTGGLHTSWLSDAAYSVCV